MTKRILALLTLLTLLMPQAAFAQQTLLPGTPLSTEACRAQYLDNPNTNGLLDSTYFQEQNAEERRRILGCAIKTGNLHLWMLPYFISYIANFFIGLAGIVSVLFVLLGGFWYMTGGLTDDKEKGKKTITYALLGMVITLLAWIIVNVVQVQVTG